MEKKNGNIYNGTWKNNQKDGSGKLELQDGSIYEG